MLGEPDVSPGALRAKLDTPFAGGKAAKGTMAQEPEKDQWSSG
jgi:hypothetical protein